MLYFGPFQMHAGDRQHPIAFHLGQIELDFTNRSSDYSELFYPFCLFISRTEGESTFCQRNVYCISKYMCVYIYRKT